MARWHISVEDSGWSTALSDLQQLSEGTADMALKLGLAKSPWPVLNDTDISRLEASLCFTSDAEITNLNDSHRGKASATNVLSFATLDDPDMPIPPDGPILLGDVIMARETIEKEALEAAKTLADYTRHMITHGVLHLLGYDHESETEAEVMEDLERDILGQLGVADPYATLDTHAS